MMDVIVGTYEEYLVGYRVSIHAKEGETDADEGESENLSEALFTTMFTDNAACGSIRCIASSGALLASGGVGESVRIYDLEKQVEVGSLLEHTGTVTSLAFHGSHLLTGAADGQVCIWGTKKFNLEKVLSGHKGSVTALSIHPSGKLAITAGRDKKLMSWNLSRGRIAYVTNMKTICEQLLFTPDGEHFIVVYGKKLEVFSISTASVTRTIELKARIHCIEFIPFEGSYVAAVGMENSEVTIVRYLPDGDSSSEDVSSYILKVFESGHANRVKSLKFLSAVSLHRETLDDEESETETVDILVTSSTDGKVKIWSVNVVNKQLRIFKIGEMDAGCRIICMTVRKHDAATEDEHPTSTNPTEAPRKEEPLSLRKRRRLADYDILIRSSPQIPPPKKAKIAGQTVRTTCAKLPSKQKGHQILTSNPPKQKAQKKQSLLKPKAQKKQSLLKKERSHKKK